MEIGARSAISGRILSSAPARPASPSVTGAWHVPEGHGCAGLKTGPVDGPTSQEISFVFVSVHLQVLHSLKKGPNPCLWI